MLIFDKSVMVIELNFIKLFSIASHLEILTIKDFKIEKYFILHCVYIKSLTVLC